MAEAKGPKAPDASAILRGKLTRIRLYKPGPRDADAEPEVEDLWFRLTTNGIAAIEEHFGSDAALEKALEERPMQTLRDALAVGALGVDPADPNLRDELRAVGERMIPDDGPRYWAAFEAALAIALGASEEQAGKAAAARLAVSAAGLDAQVQTWELMAKAVKGFGRPAKPSRPGSGRAGTSASSGA